MIRTVCKPASGSLGTLTYYPSDESVLGALEGESVSRGLSTVLRHLSPPDPSSLWSV